MATWRRTRHIIALYRSSFKFPVTLHRCQTGNVVSLRPYKHGLKYYDLTVEHRGRIKVQDPSDHVFHGPNWMSLRPKSIVYRRILPLLSGEHIYILYQQALSYQQASNCFMNMVITTLCKLQRIVHWRSSTRCWQNFCQWWKWCQDRNFCKHTYDS